MDIEVARRLPPHWETAENKKAFYERCDLVQLIISNRGNHGIQLHSHMLALKRMARAAEVRRQVYEHQMAKSRASAVLADDPTRAVLDVSWGKRADVAGV
jgi:hypothetical protein